MLFSIITVCFNAESRIEKTIKSILNQKNTSLEYIIVDGQSIDNTVNIIKLYESLFEGRMRWTSEPDQGLYDAMNKAIEIAQGEYLIFINAGDELCVNILEKTENILNKRKEYPDLIYGDAIVVYYHGKEKIEKIRKAYPLITLKTLRRGMGIVHQSIFTKRSVFHQIGKFDLKYPIGADWNFLIHCVLNNKSMLYIEEPVSIFGTDGLSSQVHNLQRHQIRKDNHLYRIMDLHLLKDFLNINTMIQCVIGVTNYQKLRFWTNRIKEKKNR